MSLYESVHSVLADRKGEVLFKCFGIWHILFIVLFAIIFIKAFLYTRNKSIETKLKITNAFCNIAFAILVLDFFMMPLAYGEIDIEKLPFHVCTAMCVMCFVSRRSKLLSRYSIYFTILGFISNLVYLIYPAGVMWHAVSPLTYRVIETLSFHGVMTVYGLLSICYEGNGLPYKHFYRNVVTVVLMVAWALLGNTLYNGTLGDYSHFFNWFFVVEDPFGMLNANVAPFICPFLNIAVFLAVELGLYGLYHLVRKKKKEGYHENRELT